MDPFSKYVVSAHDYEEGARGVNRLRHYYESHSKEIEEVWKRLVKTAENPVFRVRFCNLLEKYGLYVIVEDCRGIFDVAKTKTSFDLRIFHHTSFNVAVFKVTNLPIII